MAAPHTKTREQAAALRQECYRRWLGGETQPQIAGSLGLTKQGIGYHLRRARREAAADIDEHLARALGRLELIVQEAMLAWEHSKLPAETVVTERATLEGSGTRSRVALRREEQCGTPAFLAQILKAIEQERVLLGLGAPRKVAPIDPAWVLEHSGVQGLASILVTGLDDAS